MTLHSYSKVLETTELRDHIFAYADDASLARCARVHPVWTRSALELLWEKLTEITPLFKVVGPMLSQGISHYHNDYRLFYTEKPYWSGAWDRFLWYGRFIRHATLNWASVCSLSDQAIDEVSRMRPSLSITPELETLHIYSESNVEAHFINLSLLFLHESLANVSIRIPQDKGLFKSFICHLVLRVPNLKSLELRADSAMSIDHFEDSFVELLPGLKKLRKLRIPYYALTSRIIHAIKRHLKLGSITFHDGPALVAIPTLILPSLRAETFPALTELEISASFSQLTSFLSTAFSASTLKSITLQTVSLESSASLRLLLDALAQSLPMLNRMTIDGIPQPMSFDALVRETIVVSRMTLDPITSMKKLAEFHISWPLPLSLSNSELESLVSELPCIEKLSLNNCPTVLDYYPELTLDVLPVISKICPRLCSIALFVDCTVTPSRVSSVFAEPSSVHSVTPFANLKEFGLGLSGLFQDVWAFSMWLSKIIPAGCDLVYRNRWLTGVHNIVESEFGDLLETSWSGKYTTIEELTKHLVIARKDERDSASTRIRELEGRIRALEAFKAANNITVQN